MNNGESELIARAKHDPEAFGELYRRYVDRIYSYVYHRVGNAVDAEDLTARTFQRSLVAISGYRDRGAPFSAWLYRIAHNVVANWHRDRRRRDTVALDEVELAIDGRSDRLADRTLATEVMGRAIRRLDADRQALLVLKFGQGLSNAEIAAVLGRSEGAVKSLYHRTLVTLREQLAQDGGGDGRPGADRDMRHGGGRADG